ncbi:hypothetical protein N7517_007837 [Penicillium concentricum]|uniref:Uncharacterized protein n=1 Tax=Penicillium concentricum TaxID=293559 RepID=A0A9W9SBZ2_9EURO|nr:uncharacterized protein N7517_007837 [Penicillium concentricum]KAJ5375831.1 hypothetical protein N7517_007837 [Penicillium concentricum]
MGVPDADSSNIRPATVHRAEFTATHSIFDLTAGRVTITVHSLSPVSPSNYVRQPLPFSQDIQIYLDIDARWTGQESRLQGDFEEKDGLAIYSLTVKDAPLYAKASNMALTGSTILASQFSSFTQLSALSGSPKEVRGQFVEDGELSGAGSTWGEGSVVVLAHNLGKVTGGLSVNFVVGYEREAAINYLGETYTGFYRAEYPTKSSALSFFLGNYNSALLESLKLDQELVAISVTTAGPKNGNINTIDVTMPVFPIYYVMDPDYIRLTLLLVAGICYTHDLGTHYPNAIGHDDQEAEPMPIEECGNLLVLAAAYVRATGDTDWTSQHMEVFQKYTDYLVDKSVDIANQLSSNDVAGPLANETNLAIKAAVGLKAFGETSGDGFYSRIGEQHANIFFQQGLGTGRDQTHFVLDYPNWPDTWKTPYNLFPEVLLGLETFYDAAYRMGDSFSHLFDWAKSDWNTFLAGTFEAGTRDEFVDDLWSFMTNGKHNWPFSDRYVATSAHGNEPGVPILCRTLPTVGGHFALLALKGPRSIHSLSFRGKTVSESVRQNLDMRQYLVGNHIEDFDTRRWSDNKHVMSSSAVSSWITT